MSYKNAYDKVNVSHFCTSYEYGFICSICGQYTQRSDSASHQGYNLVCMRCISKISNLTEIDTIDLINAIHKAGANKCQIEESKI